MSPAQRPVVLCGDAVPGGPARGGRRPALFAALYAASAVLVLAGNGLSAENGLRGSAPLVAPEASPAAPEIDAAQEPSAPVVSTLLGKLREAPNLQAAKSVEDAIWKVWLRSGSDTADLLMNWAVESMAEKKLDRAVEYLDAVVELRPDFAEAWNKRATIHYMRDDYAKALGDIQRVLALEPRHFGALAGLGVILQEIDEKPRALEAFRRALAIHPHLESAKKAVERLAVEVEGRDI